VSCFSWNRLGSKERNGEARGRERPCAGTDDDFADDETHTARREKWRGKGREGREGKGKKKGRKGKGRKSVTDLFRKIVSSVQSKNYGDFHRSRDPRKRTAWQKLSKDNAKC
jgi:hypothetical protein